MSKPSRPHLQDEIYVIWALWRNSAHKGHMLPHSEVSSKKLFPTLPLGGVCFYPGIWGTSCAPGRLHTKEVIPWQGRDISLSSIRDMEKGKDQLDLSGLS